MKDNGTKIAFFILLSELHAAWLLLSGVVSLIRTHMLSKVLGKHISLLWMGTLHTNRSALENIGRQSKRQKA